MLVLGSVRFFWICCTQFVISMGGGHHLPSTKVNVVKGCFRIREHPLVAFLETCGRNSTPQYVEPEWRGSNWTPIEKSTIPPYPTIKHMKKEKVQKTQANKGRKNGHPASPGKLTYLLQESWLESWLEDCITGSGDTCF